MLSNTEIRKWVNDQLEEGDKFLTEMGGLSLDNPLSITLLGRQSTLSQLLAEIDEKKWEPNAN